MAKTSKTSTIEGNSSIKKSQSIFQGQIASIFPKLAKIKRILLFKVKIGSKREIIEEKAVINHS